MRRKPIFTAALSLMILMFMSVHDSHGYKFEFVTVSDIVKKLKLKFAEIDSYQANFMIVSEKLGRKTQQNGTLKYKSSNKMLIEFYRPSGQRIISNGKMMWIYIPSMNVVAEQDLKSDSESIFASGTKSGLRRLFSKYHYKFASKDQPESQQDGSKKYTIMLKQKESRSGFRSMKLWVSENFLITKAFGETSTGKKVEIEFSDIKTDISHPNGIFKFDIPPRARVIKNPMISEE
jgi:outer membrane lipoprotein carrier protein